MLAALEEHQARGDDRGRLVRRRGPVRRAQDLREPSRQKNPGATNMLVMGPWVHGGWSRSTATASATCSFGSKTAEFYRDDIELPFFDVPPQGQGPTPASCPRRGCSRPARTSGARTTPGRRRTSSRRRLYLEPNGRLSFSAPTETRRLRRVRQRPGQAGAVHRTRRHRHDARVHDRRPALRRTPAGRAGLPDRAADRRPDRRRADHRRACSSRPPAPTPTGS